MGNVTSKVDLDMGADDFIRAVVQLILDEWKIVGNGEHMKRFHPRIIDFKYPHQIEVCPHIHCLDSLTHSVGINRL